MMDELLQKLSKLGVDVEASVARFVGNKELYVKFLKKFPDDPNYINLEKSLDESDYDNAVKYSHALKGLTGNLGLNYMYERLTKMVDDLRKSEYRDLSILFQEIKANYMAVCGVLQCG